MSMYNACRYCNEPAEESGIVTCSNPKHKKLAKKAARASFNSRPTIRNAILLARETGLPENYFLQQLQNF